MKKIAIVLVPLCLLVCLGGCGTKRGTYHRAEKLLESASFAQAEALFSSLGDYGDAAEKSRECKYQLAKIYMDAEKPDYAQALRLLKEIGAYKDAIALKTDLQQKYFFPEHGYRIPRMECVVADARCADEDGKDESGSFHRYTYTWKVKNYGTASEISDRFVQWLDYIDSVPDLKTEPYLNGAYFLCADGERIGVVSTQKSDETVGVSVKMYDAPIE